MAPLPHSFRSAPPFRFAFATLCKCAALAVLMGMSLAANAFEELTDAQSLIYDRPHLTDTSAGDELIYRYSSMRSDGDAVQDHVTVSIVAADDDEKRDVAVTFLSGADAMVLPEFNGYRGNPVIIAMLEHVARELGAKTGGGALYFRNRIRDALADPKLAITQSQQPFGAEQIQISSVEFNPFSNDPYLKTFPDIESTRVSLTLSENVPGQLVDVAVETTGDDPSGFTALLTLEVPE